MEYKIFKNYLVARIDKGEEIINTIKILAEKENIKLGALSAIGAIDNVEIGVFKTKEQEYISNKHLGDFEIISLQGNISQKDKETYIHVHLSFADTENKCFGGHCNSAVVSATCELIINIIDGEIDRKFSNKIGLNLINF